MCCRALIGSLPSLARELLRSHRSALHPFRRATPGAGEDERDHEAGCQMSSLVPHLLLQRQPKYPCAPRPPQGTTRASRAPQSSHTLCPCPQSISRKEVPRGNPRLTLPGHLRELWEGRRAQTSQKAFPRTASSRWETRGGFGNSTVTLATPTGDTAVHVPQHTAPGCPETTYLGAEIPSSLHKAWDKGDKEA